jgi:hypothetical protein
VSGQIIGIGELNDEQKELLTGEKDRHSPLIGRSKAHFHVILRSGRVVEKSTFLLCDTWLLAFRYCDAPAD